MPSKCPICGNSVPKYFWNPGPARIECDVCGTYRISEYVLQRLGELRFFPDQAPEQTYAWSGAIREHYEAGAELTIRELEQLDSLVSVENDPLESIDRLLLYIYRNAESAATHMKLDKETDYPVAYAKGPEEFEFFVNQARKLGYIERGSRKIEDVGGGVSISETVWRLTLKGWERISELRSRGRKSDQAFVAMWFGNEMSGVFEKGMKPALKETGYRALRIDMDEHNEKIDDRIIAEIRRSGLLVADFTGQRGGVYFEAGFAMGLGIPIIWTCREDHIDDLHFDTQQYNHVVWSDPADLEKKLRLRIEATVPRQSVSDS